MAGAQAGGAYPPDPGNDDARSWQATGVEGNQNQSVGFDCAPEGAADQDFKAFKTMEATAARQGCALYRLADGGFLLTRWNMTRELPSLHAVSIVLRQMGAPA